MTARRRISPAWGSVIIPNSAASEAKNTGRSVSTVSFVVSLPGKDRMVVVPAISSGNRCWLSMGSGDRSSFKSCRNHSRIAPIISRGTWAKWGAVMSIPTKPGRVKYRTRIARAANSSAQPRETGRFSASMIRMSDAGGASVARSTWTRASSVAADNAYPLNSGASEAGGLLSTIVLLVESKGSLPICEATS